MTLKEFKKFIKSIPKNHDDLEITGFDSEGQEILLDDFYITNIFFWSKPLPYIKLTGSYYNPSDPEEK